MSEQGSKADLPEKAPDRPILVAVDMSDDSSAALLWACQYAEKLDAPLVVLHVIHDPAEAPGHYRRLESDALQPIEDAARAMLEEFLSTFKANHPDIGVAAGLQQVLVRGLPATRILEIAQEINARMIVMGSRGLTGLPHLLLGSKAERVVQLSPVPVTIVKTQEGRS